MIIRRAGSVLVALLLMSSAVGLSYYLTASGILEPPHNIYVSLILGPMAGIPSGLILALAWME